MRTRLLIAFGIVLALGAGLATWVLIDLPTPRVSATIASPTQTVALRPNAWTFQVKNIGPDISDLGLRFDQGDGFLTQHQLVYAGDGCTQSADATMLLCGAVAGGEQKQITLAAAPRSAGSYTFGVRFCDCGGSRRIELFGPDAPRFMLPGTEPRSYDLTWNETVTREPTIPITVENVNGASMVGVSVSVVGSKQAAVTSATGAATLGLGPLGPGTYQLAAAAAGFVTATQQIVVPTSGDPPAVSFVMAAATSYLQSGSDPSVLPGPVLIADKDNNRLLEVSPSGQLLWEFPRPGDLAAGQTFLVPDDAFYSPDGSQIVATQEEDFAVTLIDVATHKILWRYGTPGVHGSGPNLLWNPDDAMVMPNGDVVISDIVNCRLIVIFAGQHAVGRSYGRTGSCRHNPPVQFGSPNGAFPMQDGNWLVTEINGDWVSEIAPGGHVLWSTHPPGVAYPSDSNEISPNKYLTVDYSYPGQIVTFDSSGRALWRYRPVGAAALDHPSLALGLPNGDVLLNDDYNHRVIVVDPRTNNVVWQYGRTGHAGSALGLLANPDGVDLAPPYSVLSPYASSLKSP